MKLTKWDKSRISVNHFHVTYATKNGGPIYKRQKHKWTFINGVIWNWKNKSYCLEFRRIWKS